MKIRDIFLPHKSNGYHPHILAPLGLSIVLMLVSLQPALYSLTSNRSVHVLGYATDISVDNLYSLTNQERANAGVASLALNAQLTQAAQNKAQDMFNKDYWAHNSPDGLTPWYFISAAGYSYSAAGENLAKDFSTSSGVITGWMNSPEHKANMLSTTYQDVGFAVMNGNLLGSPTTLVVAMYGAPRIVSTPPPVAAAAPPAAPKTTFTPPQTVTPSVATAPVAEPIHTSITQSPKNKQSLRTISQAEVKAASTSKPEIIPLPKLASVATLQTLNWSQRVSLFLLSTLLLINLLKHTLIWRAKKRGLKHIWLRSHPIVQTSLLLVAIAAVINMGYGVIL